MIADVSKHWIVRDILDTLEKVFGGKTVILGGDFRQTLPVKKGASKPEIISSSIAESYLWNSFKVCTFKENMRLLQPRTSESEKELAHVFASWLLDIGDDDDDGLSNLISFIYDTDTLQHPSARELQQKAIVCTKNDTADMINSQILKMVDGESTIYKSSDKAIPLGNDRGAVELLYPMEYLNTLQFPGFPPHELELKVGIPIMLLRNVNLQDYIVCLTRVTDVQRFGSAGQNQTILRKLDIENISGDVMELTLWDEVAINFQKTEFDLMQKPVIIAVSSLVKKYETPDTQDFPTEILDIEGLHHIFQFHYNPYCKTGRVDIYFDDIVDKPLQITCIPTTALQLTESGESSKTLLGTPTLELLEPLIPGTPAAAVPIQQTPLTSPPSTVKQAATIASQQLTLPTSTITTPPNPSAFEQTASTGHLDETEKTQTERAKSLKRVLFPTESEEQKKNKTE
ncbi:DNA helicase [Tanacetum coccineum]|uniref:ATP-dependent DNA helicase n=1 Tax=Tanacetum coccineum TaxID=301880 RepID=A0ABQ5ADK0_9ASTR